jgi:hypothetical protein
MEKYLPIIAKKIRKADSDSVFIDKPFMHFIILLVTERWDAIEGDKNGESVRNLWQGASNR